MSFSSSKPVLINGGFGFEEEFNITYHNGKWNTREIPEFQRYIEIKDDWTNISFAINSSLYPRLKDKTLFENNFTDLFDFEANYLNIFTNINLELHDTIFNETQDNFNKLNNLLEIQKGDINDDVSIILSNSVIINPYNSCNSGINQTCLFNLTSNSLGSSFTNFRFKYDEYSGKNFSVSKNGFNLDYVFSDVGEVYQLFSNTSFIKFETDSSFNFLSSSLNFTNFSQIKLGYLDEKNDWINYEYINLSESPLSNFLPEGSKVELQFELKPGLFFNKTCDPKVKPIEHSGYSSCIFISNSTTEIGKNFEILVKDADSDNISYHDDLCKTTQGPLKFAGCANVSQLNSGRFIDYDVVDIDGVSFLPVPPRYYNTLDPYSLVFFSNYISDLDYDPSILNSFENLSSSNVYILSDFPNYFSGTYLWVNSSQDYSAHIYVSAKVNYPQSQTYQSLKDYELRTVEIDGTNKTILANVFDGSTYNDKIIEDDETGKIYFENETGGYEEINVTTFNTTIKTFKNGENRDQFVTSGTLAVDLQKVKKIRDKNHATELINSTISIMKDINITQDIVSNYDIGDLFTNSTNLTPKSTSIGLDLSNIPATAKGVTLYYVVPKESAKDVRDITIHSNGGGVPFVVEKDPIIGWYFEDPDTNESVIIEVPGDSDGGTIIVNTEPTLYNLGDIVVNYREDSCNSDEQALFKIDDLVDSKVYNTSVDNKKYTICIAHISENLNTTSNLNVRNLFNITLENNLTLYSSSSPVQARFDSDLIYWSYAIQKENPGDHSCIGSFSNLANGRFGDCDYNPNNRIWIDLGDDVLPPVTDLKYDSISQNTNVEILVEDFASGVDWASVKYCVDETNTCVPSNGNFYSQGTNFNVVCSSTEGCIKYVRVYSSDMEGNFGETSHQLRLLDRGSFCQADCTGKPSPNRYLKDCAGMNGCFYYPYNPMGIFDNGEAVAELCDFTVEGGWVGFNSTHDIKCPNGPIRETIFSTTPIEIDSSLSCDGLSTVEYPVVVNGVSIILNVVTCIN